ncbi:MAG: hypothetical protein KDD10_20515 [Phaeodactylibacter sp.]|nr:hypothetical protein [Phaeodactylibacter sp.]MCB9297588.1 hypothetical protein [Lewinellaceae bacterium]
MKNYVFLCLLSLLLWHCNVLEDDPLPESGQPVAIEAGNVVMTLNTGAGLIDVRGLLSPDITTGDVEVAKQPEFGALSVLDGRYLKYQPLESRKNYEEEIRLADAREPGREVSVTVVVRSDPSLFCVVNEFEPVYLGMPLSYSIKKGESFEAELLELFCDYERGGNAGVAEFDHPQLEDKGFEIYISTQSARLEFTPPAGFTGKSGKVYELCYDLQDQGCLGQMQFHDCPSYPQSCKYFLYTYVEIEVTE